MEILTWILPSSFILQREKRAQTLVIALLLILPLVSILGITVGSVKISWEQSFGILLQQFGIASPWAFSQQEQVIVEFLRLPRVLLGLLAGATLSVSGAAMQGLFRNPLADPSIIGVSAGASLGAGFAIVLGGVLLGFVHPFLEQFLIPISACFGGFFATLLVYKIGTSENGTSVATMLLAGIAISALAGAGLGLMNYLATDAMLRSLTFWQMGSLAGATWSIVGASAMVLLAQIGLVCRYSQPLNAMLLGESEALHLGIEVQKVRSRLILLTSIGMGVTVSLTGIIGFVGLVVPHLIRLLIGPDHRYLLMASALLGACFLVVADMIARVIVSPAELPIGIVTALLGAPFFLSLLLHQRRKMV